MNVAIGISGLILIAAITPGPNNLMVLTVSAAARARFDRVMGALLIASAGSLALGGI